MTKRKPEDGRGNLTYFLDKLRCASDRDAYVRSLSPHLRLNPGLLKDLEPEIEAHFKVLAAVDAEYDRVSQDDPATDEAEALMKIEWAITDLERKVARIDKIVKFKKAYPGYQMVVYKMMIDAYESIDQQRSNKRSRFIREVKIPFGDYFPDHIQSLWEKLCAAP